MSALEHRFSHTLDAPPSRVWRAFTEPEELTRWFAEHAEVDLRPGGAFRFWGRDVYGARRREDAAQELVRFEPEVALVFAWRFEGQPSEVAIELASADSETQPGGTRLQVLHRFPEAPGVNRVRELVDDLWRLHAGNLDAHLAGGDGVLRPDYDDPAPEIRLSIRIAAPRAKVFRALLDPATLDRWIASAAEVDARPGGTYNFGWRYEVDGRQVVGGPSRILELVENEKLVTDWPDWRGDPEVPLQTVTWLLEDDGDGTRVTLVHSGFTRAVDWSDYPFGWGHFLGALQGAVETPIG